MKLRIIVLAISILLFYEGKAQKKILSREAHIQWTKLGDYNISDDGKYVWYFEYTSKGNTLILCDLQGRVLNEWRDCSDPHFTMDSNILLFKSGNDVCFFNIKKLKCTLIKEVRDSHFFYSNKKSVLLYTVANYSRLLDLQHGRELSLPQAAKWVISKQGQAIALLSKSGKLFQIDVVRFTSKLISTTPDIEKLCFNNSGTGLVFLCRNKEGENSIFEYHQGLDSAEMILDNSKLAKGKLIDDDQFSGLSFSPNDSSLFFKIKQQRVVPSKEQNRVTNNFVVWKYDEMVLKGEPNIQTVKDMYLAVISLRSRKVLQLESDSIEVFQSSIGLNNNYILGANVTNFHNAFRDDKQRRVIRLIDTRTGKETFFMPSKHAIANEYPVFFSPRGQYVIWFDRLSTDIYSYNVEKRTISNTTRRIHLPNDIISQNSFPAVRLLGGDVWLDQDQRGFIATDKFDLWLVDPSGINSPINITGGYGRKNKIRFELDNFASGSSCESLSVRCLDSVNNNGFATIKLGSRPALNMGKLLPCLYSWGLVGGPPNAIKAKNAQVYLVTRQTASESPNLYATSDFIRYKALSDIHPENEYNWMTSELVIWKMYNGEKGKGILYKPENFDPHKKYPIIFNYYQERNEELHQFKQPDDDQVIGNSISIPEYVSAGYVVFVPDIINDKKGQIAKTAINSVESAAKYLIRKYPWVDNGRLGLQGHSFGGYETNLLVANSNLFAAASVSAGVSNLVSLRGQAFFGQRTGDEFVELGQTNMGLNVTVWNSTEKYIENSPIFKADKVTTPLLLKHADDDSAVPFQQSLEWFTALRRAGKKVWFLEYKSGDHVIGGKDAEDYSIRQRQFFDHYLMGKPAPLWMTQSISEEDAPYKSGLELDTTGRQP